MLIPTTPITNSVRRAMNPAAKDWQVVGLKFADDRATQLTELSATAAAHGLDTPANQALAKAKDLVRGFAENLIFARFAGFSEQPGLARMAYDAALRAAGTPSRAVLAGRFAARFGDGPAAKAAFDQALARARNASEALRLAKLANASARRSKNDNVKQALGEATDAALRRAGELHPTPRGLRYTAEQGVAMDRKAVAAELLSEAVRII